MTAFTQLVAEIQAQAHRGGEVHLSAAEAVTLLLGITDLQLRRAPCPARQAEHAQMLHQAQALMTAMAREHGFSREEVRSKRRSARLSDCRKAIALALNSRFPLLTSPEIGAVMNLNHTSVLYLLGRLARCTPPQQKEAA